MHKMQIYLNDKLYKQLQISSYPTFRTTTQLFDMELMVSFQL